MKYSLKILCYLLCLFSGFVFAGNPSANTDICEPAPDLSGFTFVNESVVITGDGGGDIYVYGSVEFTDNSGNNTSTYSGSVYATGDIYVGKKVTITGFAYSEGTFSQHNQGNVQVIEGSCTDGDHIPPVDLPVDELTGQCNDIFVDAAQSYSSGKLTMSGSSEIEQFLSGSRVTEFDFATQDTLMDSCGSGLTCIASGQASAKLSDFIIPDINGEEVTAASWADGLNITLGDAGSATTKFQGLSYKKVDLYGGSTVTFVEQNIPMTQMYQIDTLTLLANSTIKVSPGIYAIGKLSVPNNATVEVIGDGKVYFFVEAGPYGGDIEFDGLLVSATDKFVLVTNKKTTFNTAANFNGSVYSNGDLIFNGTTHILGKVAARNIDMRTNSKIEDSTVCDTTEDNQFEIITLPDGLTCEPHPIRVNVKDSDGLMITDYTGLITLTTTSPLGTWRLLSGSGTLTDSGNIDGQASYQFVSTDQGTVELGLFNEIATDLSVLVSGGEVDSDPALITFRPFQLKAEVADFTTANLPFDMTLTAVGKDASGVGCDVIEEYTGNQNLKFWSSYIDPDPADTPAPFGTNVEINQATVAKDKATATNQIIGFNNGVATVSVNYPDAGQIHARDDAGIGSPPADPSEDDELQGSTITIVNPLKLVISSVSGNPAESGSYDPETGSGFKRAAVRSYSSLIDVDVFDITVKAVIDCSNDPLNHCPGSDDPKAPSFHNDIRLLPSLVFPNHASAYLGTLHSEDGANILSKAMQAGELTFSNLSYDEVGVLGLQATSEDYLQSSNDITVSDVKEIGRFYPNYIAYDNHSYTAGCNDFTYMTEGLVADTPFAQSAVTVSYVMQAKAQVTAGGTEKTTQNYDSELSYPIAPNANFFDSVYSTNSLINLSSRILPSSYYDQTQWQSGVYTVTGLEMGLQKSLTGADGPYFANTPIGGINDQVEYFIKLTGIDGEKLQTDASTACTTNQCRLPADTKLSSLGDFAYGRLQAGNGHGSEFQSIRTLIEATYFDGLQFVPFSADSCTAVVNTQLSADPTMNVSNEIVVGSGISTTTLSILNGSLITGNSYFEFSAPDSRGELDYFIRLKELVNANLYAPWLLDSGNAVTCPNEAGSLKDCISGHVEFGLFRGNDRIIYRMQTFE
ncbi:MAG: hypothetical protein GY787_00145 [Alteromonadales bacterium]|nr:hypothetical protein [Alteromonadales bacterium]